MLWAQEAVVNVGWIGWVDDQLCLSWTNPVVFGCTITILNLTNPFSSLLFRWVMEERSGWSRNLTGVYWALYASYALKRVMHFSYWVILLLLFFVLVQWKMVTVPSPQCVGREFVRQYYTLLNKEPVQIHRWSSQPLSSLKIILLITFWRLPFDSFFWCYQIEVPSLPNEDLCSCYLCNQVKSLFKVHRPICSVNKAMYHCTKLLP